MLARITSVVLVLTVAHPLFAQPANTPIDFAHDVVPILRKHCERCHGGDEAKGGFSINSRQLFLESDVVAPGDIEDSRLLDLVRSNDADEQMPPEEFARLSTKEIKTLEHWVASGLPWTPGYSFAKNQYQPPLLPREVELPGPAGTHPIDQILSVYASANKVRPLEPIDDASFLRRASMDINGLLPSPDQVRRFVTSDSPDKREKLISSLLANEVEYAEHWLTFWNDWLRNDYAGTGFITGGRKQISGWLYRSLIENKPYDQFTRELVAPQSDESRGFIDGIKWRGTVSAGQTLEIQFAQSVAQSFLGINLKCASCHDSFIDRWTLSEAYSLAAVYASKPLEIHRCDKPTGETATAAWLFPEIGQLDADAPRDQRLKQLAELMTHKRNGRYARTLVNRLWAQLMGRGIIHPLDAMHLEPWDEDLLDYLANYLVEHKYDIKSVIHLIATSQAYSAKPSLHGNDGKFTFQGPSPKRLTAEQFIDAVWQLTQSAPTKFDAPIVRGVGLSDNVAAPSSTASWIWGESARKGVPPGGDVVVFRHAVDLSHPVSSGVAMVTADNAFELYIGKRRVAASEDWTKLQTVALAGVLKKGKNDIVIVARNFLDKPNLAAMFFEARVKLTDDSIITIASDESWQVSGKPPTGSREGRLGRLDGPWTTAVDLGRPTPYKQLDVPIRTGLARGVLGLNLMVRNSLLKSDFLTRSLGRPNRDQIVTSRPNELTTLEAIDLANHQMLADSLARGATRLRDSGRSAEAIANTMFESALSRPPTKQETQLIVDALDANPSHQAIEDLLWAILMTPEFLIVR